MWCRIRVSELVICEGSVLGNGVPSHREWVWAGCRAFPRFFLVQNVPFFVQFLGVQAKEGEGIALQCP